MLIISCHHCNEIWYWEDSIEGAKMTFIHCPKCAEKFEDGDYKGDAED